MYLKNDKGVTLIEVIASVVILMIILTIFMTIFPRMGLINEKNMDKNEAVNIAKQELVYWKDVIDTKEEFELFHNNPSELPNFIESCTSKETTYSCNIFGMQYNDGKFKAKLEVNTESDLEESKLNQAHVIHVQIINDEDSVISETYGYVFYTSGES